MIKLVDTRYIPVPELYFALYTCHYFTSSHDSMVYNVGSILILCGIVGYSAYRANKNYVQPAASFIKSVFFMLSVVILQVYWLDPLAQVVVLLMSILYAFVFYKQQQK